MSIHTCPCGTRIELRITVESGLPLSTFTDALSARETENCLCCSEDLYTAFSSGDLPELSHTLELHS